jgi:hypothetical protein
MKLNKPGRPKKKKRKMPKPPQEKHCRKLGYETGTERWCHAEARLIKMSCGGGIIGSRIDHKYTAWLSFQADLKMSKPLSKNATQVELQAHADEWNRLIKLSHEV